MLSSKIRFCWCFLPHIQIWHGFSFPLHVQIRCSFAFPSSCTNPARFFIPSPCTNLVRFFIPSSCTNLVRFFSFLPHVQIRSRFSNPSRFFIGFSFPPDVQTLQPLPLYSPSPGSWYHYTFQNMGYMSGKAVQGLSIIYIFNIHYRQIIFTSRDVEGGGVVERRRRNANRHKNPPHCSVKTRGGG